MILILAEKPSVGRALSSVVSHLVGLKNPNEYGCGWEQKGSFSQLPMIPEAWQFKATESTKEHKFKCIATGSAGVYGFEVRCTLPKSKKDRLRIYRKDGLPIYHHMFIPLTRLTEQPFSGAKQ